MKFLFPLLVSGCALGCASQGEPQSPSSLKCPPGQIAKEGFCVTDGLVPTPQTQEKPTPEEQEEEATTAEGTEQMNEPGVEAAPEVDCQEPTDGELPLECQPPVDSAEAKVLEPAEATPVDLSMAAQAGPLIQYLAASHLPGGSRPYGSPFAAQFAEGQVFDQEIQLNPGHCYTVVAAGLPPVVELELVLEALPLATTTNESSETTAAAPPFAQDTLRGAQAILGGRSSCLKVSLAGAYRLRVEVSQGQGVVAGQVFIQ
ncbi:MAG: hypothetical protein MK135_08310 [Polyangiaceae bacterium]|nr:hypothetical protein [Polyangiaceae bacterium]